MFVKNSTRKCQGINKITESGIVICPKPAKVLLCLDVDSQTVILCLDCARKLAKEIIDSISGRVK